MADGTSGSGLWPDDRFSRPRYEAGAYLTAADCQLEQRYRLNRLRRHDRQLHGVGVVCGLWVVPAADPSRPWAVRVCPGYAVGPHGDEMQVVEPAVVDVHEALWAKPAAPFTSTAAASVVGRRIFIYIAIRAIDRLDRLAPVPSADCGCAEPIYRESRIADGYEVAAIWTRPEAAPVSNICGGLPSCPACADSPWLALARVAPPSASGQPITAGMIDNGIRRTV